MGTARARGYPRLPVRWAQPLAGSLSQALAELVMSEWAGTLPFEAATTLSVR